MDNRTHQLNKAVDTLLMENKQLRNDGEPVTYYIEQLKEEKRLANKYGLKELDAGLAHAIGVMQHWQTTGF